MSPSGSSAMAVRAHDVALRHLVEDGLPVPTSEALADAEPLVAEVIEFQNQRIRLPAVGTWVRSQVLDEETHPFFVSRPLPLRLHVNVALAIGDVVRASDFLLACPAVVLPLAEGLSMPRERLEGLHLPAPTTPSSWW